jgi:hypothetical protein
VRPKSAVQFFATAEVDIKDLTCKTFNEVSCGKNRTDDNTVEQYSQAIRGYATLSDDEKKFWKDMAAEDKARFEKEMWEWQKTRYLQRGML